mmetsp:Transcript_5756/g.8468  ORF Transcript_5756/g.8468 Transcript_5756/m.8468 type:complete len:89 (-) Transcript_5756:466-732(-)
MRKLVKVRVMLGVMVGVGVVVIMVEVAIILWKLIVELTYTHETAVEKKCLGVKVGSASMRSYLMLALCETTKPNKWQNTNKKKFLNFS